MLASCWVFGHEAWVFDSYHVNRFVQLHARCIDTVPLLLSEWLEMLQALSATRLLAVCSCKRHAHTFVDCFHSWASIEWPQELAFTDGLAAGLTHSPHRCLDVWVCWSVSVGSDDPLFHKRFIDIHIDCDALDGLSILDCVQLAHCRALTDEFLQTLRCQDDLMQGENLCKDILLDKASLFSIDLDKQLFNLLFDLVTLLLVNCLFERVLCRFHFCFLL